MSVFVSAPICVSGCLLIIRLAVCRILPVRLQRADYRFDEFDLFYREIIFRVQIFVRPLFGPSAREQGDQFRDGEAVKLVPEDVIDALLPVGNLPLQSGIEPLGNLAQEYT